LKPIVHPEENDSGVCENRVTPIPDAMPLQASMVLIMLSSLLVGEIRWKKPFNQYVIKVVYA